MVPRTEHWLPSDDILDQELNSYDWTSFLCNNILSELTSWSEYLNSISLYDMKFCKYFYLKKVI
jgi:hypothetical protein